MDALWITMTVGDRADKMLSGVLVAITVRREDGTEATVPGADVVILTTSSDY